MHLKKYLHCFSTKLNILWPPTLEKKKEHVLLFHITFGFPSPEFQSLMCKMLRFIISEILFP